MGNEQSVMTDRAASQRSRAPVAAIWIAAVAIILAVGLVVPYLALASRAPLLVLLLAAAAAIAGIMLAVRARRTGSSGAAALICAAAALLTAVTMAVVFVIGMVSATSMNIVELQGHGPAGSSASTDSDLGPRTETWPADGRATISTKGSWAELTLVAPADATSQTVSCQIIWNGEIVVTESSDSGTVTCRYDEG